MNHRTVSIQVRALTTPGGPQTGLAVLAVLGITACSALVANVASSRAIGPVGRGQVALVLQAAYLLFPFVVLGADRKLLRGESDDPWPNRAPSLALLVLCLGISLPFIALSGDYWFLAFAPVVLGQLALTIIRARGIGSRNIWMFLPWVIGFQVNILMLCILFALTGVGTVYIWLLAWASPGIVLGAILTARWIGRGCPAPAWRKGFDRSALRLLPGSVGSIVLTRGERLLIPAIAGVGQLGIYLAVATFTEVAAWLGQAAGEVFSRSAEGERMRGAVPIVGLTVGVSASIALVLQWKFVAVFGQAFESAVAIILPLSLAAVVLSIYRLAIGSVLSSNRPELSSVVEVCAALVSLPIYIVAIRISGIEGAAWGSLASYTLGSLFGGAAIFRIRRCTGVQGV